MSAPTAGWLLNSGEPWTRYRTLVDVMDRPAADAAVREARAALLTHTQVRALISAATAWPGPALKRHNDAGHSLYKLTTLADFGLQAGDPGLDEALDNILAHQSAEGAFQSLLNISPTFGGSGEDQWAWVLCDAPTLLYVVLAMGGASGPGVRQAVEHLVGLAGENGYRCVAAPALGRFRGPGRKTDPCPVANLYALKALAKAAECVDRALLEAPAAHAAAEMLLGHWERGGKPYLFGAGTDYRKLKYPFVWYDLLHVTHVLSHFAFVHADPRFGAMLDAIAAQVAPDGRYTAGSMYQAWKGWSFADKKNPSPWLTYLVLSAFKRAGRAQAADWTLE